MAAFQDVVQCQTGQRRYPRNGQELYNTNLR